VCGQGRLAKICQSNISGNRKKKLQGLGEAVAGSGVREISSCSEFGSVSQKEKTFLFKLQFLLYLQFAK